MKGRSQASLAGLVSPVSSVCHALAIPCPPWIPVGYWKTPCPLGPSTDFHRWLFIPGMPPPPSLMDDAVCHGLDAFLPIQLLAQLPTKLSWSSSQHLWRSAHTSSDTRHGYLLLPKLSLHGTEQLRAKPVCFSSSHSPHLVFILFFMHSIILLNR